MKSANKLKHGNIASIVLCLVVLCSIFLNPQSVVSENNLNTSLVETVSLPGFQQIAENEKMKLFANTENGEISVYVKDTGYIWRSNPVDHEQDSIAKGQYKNALASQIILYYSQGFSEISVNSKAGSVDKGGLKFEKIDKGIKFTFTFPDIEYSIPVQYQLEKDYLKAQVLTEEITPELVTRTEERGQ